MGCLLRKMSGHVIPKESELRRDTQQHPENYENELVLSSHFITISYSFLD